MDSHLKGIPGLGTLTTRGLSGGNLEGLGWEADWALHTEILRLRALDELLADLLERLDLSAGQGDADLVGFLQMRPLECTPQIICSRQRTGPSPNSFSGFW